MNLTPHARRIGLISGGMILIAIVVIALVVFIVHRRLG